MCETIKTIHPFEKSGLGVAPFRFTGVFESVYQACPGAPIQAAGMCDYCGTCIRYCYNIQSADGKKFVVGCDCVLKLGRDDNALVSAVDKARLKLESDQRAAKRAAKNAKDTARIAAAFELLKTREDLRAHFVALAHPFKFDSDGKPREFFTGLTMFDYLGYLRDRAGISGGLRAAREIENAAKTTAAAV